MAFTAWDHTSGGCLVFALNNHKEKRQTNTTLMDSNYRPMHLKPILLPLNVENVIYILQDERGKLISAGSREVCELLLHTLNKDETDSAASEIAWFVHDAAIVAGM